MIRKNGSYLLLIFLSIFAGSAFCALPDPELENAYQTLFTKEFGYTLIGEKPVSIEDAIESEYLHTHPDERSSSLECAWLDTALVRAGLTARATHHTKINVSTL